MLEKDKDIPTDEETVRSIQEALERFAYNKEKNGDKKKPVVEWEERRDIPNDTIKVEE